MYELKADLTRLGIKQTEMRLILREEYGCVCTPAQVSMALSDNAMPKSDKIRDNIRDYINKHNRKTQ